MEDMQNLGAGQTYIGVKLIKAVPMDRQAYNDYRGWTLPDDEVGADAGYLVEYLDGGQANHPDHAGYISWSPAEVFDRAYRPTAGMTFGLAIEAMKKGAAVARQGWNGKGMWVALTPGSAIELRNARCGHATGKRAAEILADEALLGDDGEEMEVELLPHIDMRAADGSMVIGWLASQTDMLAEDWHIVEIGGAA